MKVKENIMISENIPRGKGSKFETILKFDCGKSLV